MLPATTLSVNEAAKSAGQVYYVAPPPAGNDSNPGTASQPWRTIQKAANTLVAGDTVFIKTGVYSERVEPQNSGSPANEILYAASPGATVTIDGANVVLPEWTGLFSVIGKQYIRLSGLRVINAGPNPHNPGILVESSAHIVIENNYVRHTSDSGIAAWNSQDVVIDHNEVTDVNYSGYNEAISIGGTDGFEVKNNHVHHSPKEGIDPKDGAANGKVFRNHVHHTGAVGIYVDAWDKHVYNIDVYENVVHDVAADGFSIGSEQGGLLENVRLYNNVAYNNKWVGIDLHACCIASHPVHNVQIVNNTLYNNGWDPWGGGISVSNPQATNILIRNNICSQNLYFQIAIDPGLPAGNAIIDHNLIDGYRGTEGETYGDDYVVGDPKFAHPASAQFHLRSDSPAIDQGSSLSAPATDFDGQPRPLGPKFDIGADEYMLLPIFTYLPMTFVTYP